MRRVFLTGHWRRLAVIVFDLLCVAAAWWGAYLLRFNFDVAATREWQPLVPLWWMLPGCALLFKLMGLYRGIWRFASLPDLLRILRAVILTGLLVAGAAAFGFFHQVVPRSVLLLFPLGLLLLMGGGRLAYRVWREFHEFGAVRTQGKPVLILGAGSAGVMLARELSRSSQWQVLGFMDDDPAKQQRELMGYPVFGSIAQVAEFAGQLRARHAILAMPSARHGDRRRIANLCAQAGLQVLTVPPSHALVSGLDSVSHVRQVNVEDLLGREQVELDDAGLHQFITGRCVMVTGAGGSIGSELCRQIAAFDPALLLFVEQSEFALYTLEQEFVDNFRHVRIRCLAADVRDPARLDEIMVRYRPQVIFHAAAYKHVPLMEVDNAWQAVRTNVGGTLEVARAARRHGVNKVVLISTDKAVNPTNVMGATKRLAEQVCEALQAESAQGGTRFVIVRFGNVLGSNGSVIPKFREQIARGGPVTVTHPKITRFFMTIPEAAQLVLQAGLMGRGGEIFVLDMGEPVQIAELARDMIRLSGFSEDEIRIVYTGLRPGEKLYEEVLADAETTLATPHPKLRIARARPVPGELISGVEAWLSAPEPLADGDVRQGLARWVPEYQPTPSG